MRQKAAYHHKDHAGWSTYIFFSVQLVIVLVIAPKQSGHKLLPFQPHPLSCEWPDCRIVWVQIEHYSTSVKNELTVQIMFLGLPTLCAQVPAPFVASTSTDKIQAMDSAGWYLLQT